MAARPTRSVVPTSAQIIAAGSQSSSPILPATSTSKVDVMAPGQSAKLYDMFESGDDDPNPDTNGFVWNDENIFETGGLPQSNPGMFKHRSSIAPKHRITTPLVKSIKPGHEIFHNGEYYEFIGYAGDVELSDEELSSFEGEPGEYSNFLPLLGAFKIGKKLFKNRKKIGKGIKGIGQGIRGLKGIFRKRKKKQTARFDGLVEYEYFIGPDPVYSDLFGIKLKKIGKAIGKPFKAIGKGIKKVGKGIGSVGRFLGRNIKAGAELIKGSQEARIQEAKALQAQALAANNDSGGGQLNPNEQSYQQPLDYDSGDVQVPYINPDNGEMVIPNYNRNEAQDDSLPASNNNNKTILYVGIALVVVLIAYLIKNQK